VIGPRADLSRGYSTGGRGSESNTPGQARNQIAGRSLPNQVRRREGPTYPATDDSQSLMPYKQDTAIESVLSLLMRHKFYYLDTTASADQH
jgi:hypothetical protein